MDCLIEYYAKFQTALFMASMTMGTFLFAMKTFIVQTMKKEVYSRKEYDDFFLEFIKSGGTGTRYQPLKNLSKALLWAISLSFASGAAQIVVGFFLTPEAVLFCLLLTLASWCALVVSLVLVSVNLRTMFEFSEHIDKMSSNGADVPSSRTTDD